MPESRYTTSKIRSAPFFDILTFLALSRNFPFLLHRIRVRLYLKRFRVSGGRSHTAAAGLPLDGTFDFNLCAEKDSRRAADLERDFGLLRVVLDVRGVAGRDRRLLVVRGARHRVAGLRADRLDVRAELVAALDLVLLRHDLLALDPALLHAAPAGPAKQR